MGCRTPRGKTTGSPRPSTSTEGTIIATAPNSLVQEGLALLKSFANQAEEGYDNGDVTQEQIRLVRSTVVPVIRGAEAILTNDVEVEPEPVSTVPADGGVRY